MKIDLGFGDQWVELDGDVVVDSSMPKEEAEAYITDAMKQEAIEESMLSFVKTISGAWTAYNGCEAEDINNTVWLGLLKFRDDPERWNVRYLKSKAVYLTKKAIKDTVVDVLPYDGEPIEYPAKDWSDLYDLIDSVQNERQRSILRLKAKGLSLQKIGDKLNLSVAQIRTALSKGYAELKKRLYNLPEDRREDLRSLWS